MRFPKEVAPVTGLVDQPSEMHLSRLLFQASLHLLHCSFPTVPAFQGFFLAPVWPFMLCGTVLVCETEGMQNLTRRLHQCTPELFWAEDPISLRCWGKKKGNRSFACELSN